MNRPPPPATDKWCDADFVRVWDARPPSALRREQLDILAAIIADNSRPGDRILNLGCGTGRVEELLMHRAPGTRLTSVDRSPVMLDLARERLAGKSDRVTFVQMDLARFDRARLPGGPFRFITAVNVVHELSNPSKSRLLRSCCSRLTANGLLLIIDRIAVNRTRLRAAYLSTLRRLQRLTGEESGELSTSLADPRSPEHEHPLGLDAWLCRLRAAGFDPAVLHCHFHKVLLVARRRARTVDRTRTPEQKPRQTRKASQ